MDLLECILELLVGVFAYLFQINNKSSKTGLKLNPNTHCLQRENFQMKGAYSPCICALGSDCRRKQVGGVLFMNWHIFFWFFARLLEQTHVQFYEWMSAFRSRRHHPNVKTCADCLKKEEKRNTSTINK